MGFVPPHQQYGKQVTFLTFPAYPNADGFKTPGNHVLVLPVNPDITDVKPWRTTPTQTIQGVYTDNFGGGVRMLSVSGHTGYWRGVGLYQGQPVDGFTAYNALNDEIIQYYFDLIEEDGTTEPAVTLQYINDIDEQFYDLMPTQNFQLLRSHSKPFLYQFQAQFIVLADHHQGSTIPVPDPIDPLLGGSTTIPGLTITTTTTPAPRSPAQAPSATALPPPARKVVVQAGQTLWAIASQQLQTTNNTAIQKAVNAIAAANHLANPNKIYVGQVLIIPAIL